MSRWFRRAASVRRSPCLGQGHDVGACANPLQLLPPSRLIGSPCDAGLQRESFMPLVRDHERFEFTRLEGVYFSMRDGANHVLCKVSHEALRDRSARDGENISLSDTFVRHRQRIEVIASEKYGEGHRANDLILVLSKDLTPLPI